MGRTPWCQQLAEVESFLNERDQKASRRRPHHLPDEWYSTTCAVYCVTLCARHHGAPFCDSALAAEVVAALRFHREAGRCLIHAYCLMPDHLHAILQLRDSTGSSSDAGGETPPNLRTLIRAYNRYTTTQVAWKHGLHGRLWQKDFYDHIARNPQDFEEQCRYTLENPVRKGMVEVWNEYPWSGIVDEWRIM